MDLDKINEKNVVNEIFYDEIIKLKEDIDILTDISNNLVNDEKKYSNKNCVELRNEVSFLNIENSFLKEKINFLNKKNIRLENKLKENNSNRLFIKLRKLF